MTRIALLQLNASDDPAENLPGTLALIREAAAQGAELILTPEVTNCVSTSRRHQAEVLQFPEEDQTLAAIRAEAETLGVWVLIGSLGVQTGDADGRFANRCFLISDTGDIIAEYDKIHMFDVEIDAQESFRESAGYRPGDRAVVADTPFGKIGLAICYDLRFPQLFRALAQAGAQILTVPAAFSPVSGAAHWEPLLRARAIENGCFVLAPAQTGNHASAKHPTRDTYGHSLAVSPWGELLLDAGTSQGCYIVDLDLEKVDTSRRRIPSLANARDFNGP